MNALQKAEKKVSECEGILNGLLARQEKENEVLAKWESEKKQVVAKGDGDAKSQKKYREIFEKISDLSFEKEKLDDSIIKTEKELGEARNALKTLREEQQARLDNHIRIREQEGLDAFVRELPSLQEKIIQHYFELCQEIASIQTRGSKLSVNGAPTPRCQAIAEFWNLFPHCLIEAFKENTFTIAPRPWAEEIRLQPYLKGSGSFAGAIAENLEKEREAFKKEFFAAEEKT